MSNWNKIEEFKSEELEFINQLISKVRNDQEVSRFDASKLDDIIEDLETLRADLLIKRNTTKKDNQ